jgi:thymidylate synthase ThyX
MIQARVVCDSVNPDGVRLTTMLLTYPRMVHAEIMTHRAFSRNGASSRAIPSTKLIRSVRDNPAGPVFWGRNQAGMQAAEELGQTRQYADCWWNAGAEQMCQLSEQLHALGVHKQIANRPLETFSYMTLLVTATDRAWKHFFALRCHKDAQPEMQVAAYRALAAYLKSTPTPLHWGEWHVPFGEHMSPDMLPQNRLKIAVARCARLSYMTFDGDIDPEKDFDLYHKLSKSDPAHASAFEHVAQALYSIGVSDFSNFDVGYFGNLDPLSLDGGSGWLQFRKTIPNEFNGKADLGTLMANKPDWITLDAPAPLAIAA